MRKIFCDICDEEMKENDIMHGVEIHSFNESYTVGSARFNNTKTEICLSCAKAIQTIITNKAKMQELKDNL